MGPGGGLASTNDGLVVKITDSGVERVDVPLLPYCHLFVGDEGRVLAMRLPPDLVDLRFVGGLGIDHLVLVPVEDPSRYSEVGPLADLDDLSIRSAVCGSNILLIDRGYRAIEDAERFAEGLERPSQLPHLVFDYSSGESQRRIIDPHEAGGASVHDLVRGWVGTDNDPYTETGEVAVSASDGETVRHWTFEGESAWAGDILDPYFLVGLERVGVREPRVVLLCRDRDEVMASFPGLRRSTLVSAPDHC